MATPASSVPGLPVTAASVGVTTELAALSRRTRMDWPGCVACVLGSGAAAAGGDSETLSTSPFAWAALTLCFPAFIDADWMGDGGGWSSLNDEGDLTCGESIDDDEMDVGDEAESLRLRRASGGREDRLARLDLMELASDRSTDASVLLRMAEDLGLSFLPLPGILDRSDLNDRVESFVSDRLNEGYDCRPSGPDDLEDAPPLSFEPWFPMLPEGEEEARL